MTRDPEEAAVNDALNELEEDGKISTEYENGELRHQLTDDGQAYIESRIAESPAHQMLLLQMSWNDSAMKEETLKKQLDSLFCFVAKVRDEIGVNLLRAREEQKEHIDQDPLPEFTEATLQRFDPDVSTAGTVQGGGPE